MISFLIGREYQPCLGLVNEDVFISIQDSKKQLLET